MLNRLLSVLLSIFLFLSSTSFNIFLLSRNFNTSRVIKDIEYLSGENFKGRLSGTLENASAATYLKNKFTDLGLKPFKDSYYSSFNVSYPKEVEGSPHLCVYNSDKTLVKSYVYNEDYKESMLNFKINRTCISKNNIFYKNETCICANSPEGPVAIFTTSDNAIEFRSSFYVESKYVLSLQVTASCFEELLAHLENRKEIDIFIPYTNDTTEVNNVAGVIKGKNPSLPPLVISAHFDHVGSDLNGNTYCGALDNASGTSFVLELIKYIRPLGIPSRDIIFVMFNGEELGLKGSQAFAAENESLLSGAHIYNFDMIGSDDGIPLCIMAPSEKTAEEPILADVANICREQNVFFNSMFEDSSDHASFSGINANAITICDYDTTRIHTPEDTVEHISESAIERCFSVIKPQLDKEIWGDNILYLHPGMILVISLGASLILSIITIIRKKQVL